MKNFIFGSVFIFGIFLVIEPSNAQNEGLGTPGYQAIDVKCEDGSFVTRCRWNDLSSCDVSSQDHC